ncbi:MAG: hypothetical protein K0S76_169 [Herbinix sp.]|jgi:uncharacterized repeat protein (TIGR02543 family)|nr:hypothetical protein [Herbinix sp.]
MKKILLTVAVMVLTALSFSSVAYAADNSLYEQALEDTKNERTDAYALDYYKYGPYYDDPLYVKWANKITVGITNEYDKAQAIFNWVVENSIYSDEGSNGFREFEKNGYMQFTCVGYAATTQNLLNAVGLPAKTVAGGAKNAYGWDGHEWNEVYVDNRWVYVDSTWGEFDLPMSEWSQDHSVGPDIKNQDEEAWNGSLYFYDYDNDKMLKEVKNFPFNGLVNSTYSFDIKELYLDKHYTKPFKLNTLKVDSQTALIYVKPLPVAKKYEVTFNSNHGTIVKAVTVTAKATITKPKSPTRKGYKFVAWYTDSKLTKKWDFTKSKVTKNTTLYAKWQRI